MTMPEASVYEDCRFVFMENNIRFASQGFYVFPKPKSCPE
jgi:hypothetical protein